MSTVASFFEWWASELRGMLPAARDRSRTTLRHPIIALEADGMGRLLDHKGGAVGQQARPMAELIGELLRGAGRGQQVAGIRVRASDCLARTVELPAMASRNFAQMLLLDLERSTPLKARDVLSAHIVEGERTGGGMARVRHLVVKSRTIEPVLAQLRAAGIDVVSVDCWNGDGTAALPVNFLESGKSAGGASRSGFAGWTAALAVVLAITATLIHWDRQHKALVALTAETLRLTESARETRLLIESVRATGAGVEHLRRLKADRPPATMILEEVTRLLPDTAWLQEFRLDNDVVEIAGLAVGASALLTAFERSAMFHETSFTAPLRLETGEDRERFRLRTRLKPAVAKPTEAGQ